tara:strand:- start:36773 stop:36946 length:174 start_codon:yes stop_codon:yes gene_type:complete
MFFSMGMNLGISDGLFPKRVPKENKSLEAKMAVFEVDSISFCAVENRSVRWRTVRMC